MPASGHRPNISVPAARPEPDAEFLALKCRRHVALAVSGGSDSMALLHLAWRQRQGNFPHFSVITVDHGLRAGSLDEAKRVAAWASKLGLPHHILAWTGDKPPTGIQAKARRARYDLMSAWCRANDAEALVTAHTLDDQAETVSMRLERTLSPASLAGIPELGEWNGVPLLRPLLGLRREALKVYLRSLGQEWIDDPSNDDQRYERVRARAQIARHGHAERLAGLARQCAAAVNLLDRCAERWIGKRLKETDAGICYAPLREFQPLPPALQQRILGLIIQHYGGGPSPERAELARLVRWLDDGSVPRCTLGGAIAGRRKREFWVTREAARIDPVPRRIGSEGRTIWDGRFLVTGPKGTMVGPAGSGLPLWTEGTPVYARRSCPEIVLPAGVASGVRVEFLRLQSLNGTFTPSLSLEMA